MQKVVFISGCSSGIGLDLAIRLKNMPGMRVIPSVRKTDDISKLQSMGFADVIRLDIQSPASITDTLEILKSFGPLYALVNNAWSGLPAAQEDLSSDALRHQHEYFFGTVQLTQGCLPLLQACDRARVIQVSSLLGFSVLPFRGAYASAKFAWEAHSEALRLELSHLKSNISVCVIQPGPIATRFRENSKTNFDRWIDSSSRYASNYQKLLARLVNPNPSPGTLQASAVTDAIMHALTSERPRNYYRVTQNTTLLMLIERLLPSRLKDEIKRNMY